MHQFKVIQRTSSLYHAKLQDEQQLAWDQREVELERQLDQYEKHHNQIVNSSEKVSYCLQLLIMDWLNLTASKHDDFTGLDLFDCCFQYEDGTGSLPDPSLPLAHQLEFALGKIRAHVRTILDTQATCKSLDEV